MKLILVSLGVFFISALSASAADITVLPNVLKQGSPLLIQVVNMPVGITVTKFTIDTAQLNLFQYMGNPSALYGIPLLGKTGERKIVAQLSNGETVTKIVVVDSVISETRTNPPIPKKLGGNTVANEKKVISQLERENAILGNLFSQPKALWHDRFIPPLMKPIVTDTYGYIRQGGAGTITHKGTDFRAKEGTPIIAMNRGIVRIAKRFTVYGKAIIIDHGQGVQTLYMHLSRITVAPGQMVERGSVIGYSGKTGYAEKPHLHLSVRIGGASIDPELFIHLFAGN